MLVGYSAFVDLVAKLFFGLGVFAGVICLVDWAIRARKIPPFSAIARFFRRRVDPLMKPLASRVVGHGGQPASAPLWVFLGVAITGIVIVKLLGVGGGLLLQVSAAASKPRLVPTLALSWSFQFLIFALMVRVISSWLPVSPYSKWIRWSYRSTEWILAPLRKVIPAVGTFDVTPIAAYFLLVIVARLLGV